MKYLILILLLNLILISNSVWGFDHFAYNNEKVEINYAGGNYSLVWPKSFAVKAVNSRSDILTEESCGYVSGEKGDRRVMQKIAIKLMPFDTRNIEFRKALSDYLKSPNLENNFAELNAQYFIAVTAYNAKDNVQLSSSEYKKLISSLRDVPNLERHIFETDSMKLGCDLKFGNLDLNLTVTVINETLQADDLMSADRLLEVSRKLRELFSQLVDFKVHAEQQNNFNFNYMLSSMAIREAVGASGGLFSAEINVADMYQVLNILLDEKTGKPKSIGPSEAAALSYKLSKKTKNITDKNIYVKFN